MHSKSWAMDWIVSNWDQVGSYNLGTAMTGLALLVLCVGAWFRTKSAVARAIALSFAGIGLYMAYRGGWWFSGNQLAPNGVLYHPFVVENRWTIWLTIVPMELALIWLYMLLFRHHGMRGALLVAAILSGYVLGGLI